MERLHLFKEIIEEELGFTKEEWEYSMAKFRPLSLAKGDFFLTEKEKTANKIAFVQEGILRNYYVEDGYREVTTQFYTQGGVILSLQRLKTLTSVPENIPALTDSLLFVIEYEGLQELYRSIPKWQLLCIRWGEVQTQELQTYTCQLQNMKATERYKKFMEAHAEIVQQVPLTYIASYLGIAPETMSRIRNKI